MVHDAFVLTFRHEVGGAFERKRKGNVSQCSPCVPSRNRSIEGRAVGPLTTVSRTTSGTGEVPVPRALRKGGIRILCVRREFHFTCTSRPAIDCLALVRQDWPSLPAARFPPCHAPFSRMQGSLERLAPEHHPRVRQSQLPHKFRHDGAASKQPRWL